MHSTQSELTASECHRSASLSAPPRTRGAVALRGRQVCRKRELHLVVQPRAALRLRQPRGACAHATGGARQGAFLGLGLVSLSLI